MDRIRRRKEGREERGQGIEESVGRGYPRFFSQLPTLNSQLIRGSRTRTKGNRASAISAVFSLNYRLSTLNLCGIEDENEGRGRGREGLAALNPQSSILNPRFGSAIGL